MEDRNACAGASGRRRGHGTGDQLVRSAAIHFTTAAAGGVEKGLASTRVIAQKISITIGAT